VLFFEVFGLLPRNRLAAMKDHQATQPIFTQFSGFYDELPGGNEEPPGDTN